MYIQNVYRLHVMLLLMTLLYSYIIVFYVDPNNRKVFNIALITLLVFEINPLVKQ